MTGQINYENNRLGQQIVALCKQADINTIVEVGTWNGLGTTRCVLQGLKEANKTDYTFVSFECCPEQYITAVNNNSKNINKNFNIIYGKLVDEEQIYTWLSRDTVGSEWPGHPWLTWLDQDYNWMLKVPNTLYAVPEKIDFLILDGGEFTTYLEWHALKDRVTYCALDDTNVLKSSKIRAEVLNSPEFEIIEDNPHVTNGFLIFKRKSL